MTEPSEDSRTRECLAGLGWLPFFQQQLALEEYGLVKPARVMGQARDRLTLATADGEVTLALRPNTPALVVGDWLLLDDSAELARPLERFSLFSRKAPGAKIAQQLIAANVNTVFVVTSLNRDFNLNRIERYLTIVRDAGADAVVVLTRLDQCADHQPQLTAVQRLDPLLQVEAVNALDALALAPLAQRCGTGQTVLFLGSSGVGKSTLVNTLMGTATQATAAARQGDDKGRHTTTGRSLHQMPNGGLLLDTPGMRELQIADVEQGIEDTFSDVAELAQRCRFADCVHETEPGCAVRAALEDGTLEQRRLENYRRLMRENALNSASLAEKRSRDRELGRFYRSVQAESRRRKKDH